MHAVVGQPHVDHLHPDAGIALATAADGEALTRACFGERVLWVPWRRPGFQLGLDIAEVAEQHPDAIGVILGGHGITAWGASSAECERRSLEIIHAAQAYIDANGRPSPFGAKVDAFAPLPDGECRCPGGGSFPDIARGLASTDSRQVGHYTDSATVLDFLASERHHELAMKGTSCPDHFLRTRCAPWSSTYPLMRPSTRPSLACASCTRNIGLNTGPITSATPPRSHRPCEVPTPP